MTAFPAFTDLGSRLRVTEEHRFYVPERGAFVPLAHMASGEHLFTLDSDPSNRAAPTIADVKWPAYGAKDTVYNLTVSGQHNYFAAGVLVHNKSPPPEPEPPPRSVCGDGAGFELSSPEDDLVDDFENSISWEVYAAEEKPLSWEIVAPGANGTAKAAHVRAPDLVSWGASMVTFLGCTYVPEHEGLSFWGRRAKGATEKMVVAVTLPTTEPGADCEPDGDLSCGDHPRATVPLTEHWAQYWVRFEDMEQAGFGVPASFDDMIRSVVFQFPAPDADVYIDEVRFFSGEPPTACASGFGGSSAGGNGAAWCGPFGASGYGPGGAAAAAGGAGAGGGD